MSSEHSHEHHTPAEIDWDSFYQDEDQLWSGRVNGSLVAEVTGLVAGRALDVGCGEGADALWLAEQGWSVSAIDIAPTAVERARAEAARRAVDIEWLVGDLLDDPLSGQAFDLVSVHYPGFDIRRRDEVVAALTGAVAPAGTLLVVGHAPPDDPDELPFDPNEWVQPPDILAVLPDGWIVQTDETRARPGDHHHGSHHSHDVVLRASRPPGA